MFYFKKTVKIKASLIAASELAISKVSTAMRLAFKNHGISFWLSLHKK